MTVKDVKNYLYQVQKWERMIQDKNEEIAKWKARAVNITASSDADRVQSSGSKEKMADAVISFVDIEKELMNEISLIYQRQKTIIGQLEMLPANEYTVLYKRYVNGMTLVEIADDIKKSERWVCSVHGIALKKFQELMNNNSIKCVD